MSPILLVLWRPARNHHLNHLTNTSHPEQGVFILLESKIRQIALPTMPTVAVNACAHASKEYMERMRVVRIGDVAELTATEDDAHLDYTTMAPQMNANHAREEQ